MLEIPWAILHWDVWWNLAISSMCSNRVFSQQGVFNCVLWLKDLFEILKQRSPVYGIWDYYIYIPAAGSCSSIVYISWTIIQLIQIMVPTIHTRSSRARPWKRDGWKNDPFHLKKKRGNFLCGMSSVLYGSDGLCFPIREAAIRRLPEQHQGFLRHWRVPHKKIAARRRRHCVWPAGRYIGRYISVPRQPSDWQGGENAENGAFLPDASWTKGLLWSWVMDRYPAKRALCLWLPGRNGLCLLHAGKVFRMDLTLWP